MKKALALFVAGVFAACPAFADEREDRVKKGNEYVTKKEYKKALGEFEAALKSNPQDAKLNLIVGMTYATLGDFDKAAKFTEASLKLEPSSAGYQNMGLIYANRSNFPKSIENYENALKLSPSSYRLWYQAGLVQASAGDFLKAMESHKKAIEYNPLFKDAYLGLASAYYWAGDRASALAQVERLRTLKAATEAEALAMWIENTDKKKAEIQAAAK